MSVVCVVSIPIVNFSCFHFLVLSTPGPNSTKLDLTEIKRLFDQINFFFIRIIWGNLKEVFGKLIQSFTHKYESFLIYEMLIDCVHV